MTQSISPDIATVVETAIRDYCRKSPGFPDLSLTAMAKDIVDAINAQAATPSDRLRCRQKLEAEYNDLIYLQDTGEDSISLEKAMDIAELGLSFIDALGADGAAQAGWKWLPVDHRPLKTGTYLVGHRGHQEIMKFFGPDIEWEPGTKMGWLRLTNQGWNRDDPAKRFNATYCVMIDPPGSSISSAEDK